MEARLVRCHIRMESCNSDADESPCVSEGPLEIREGDTLMVKTVSHLGKVTTEVRVVSRPPAACEQKTGGE